ncbi:hypothetical protein F5X97DRAFT_308829 [Nemania serpens]|nr:hypothetical protein F5X97DRAFT_308829 [Nemania serpens]
MADGSLLAEHVNFIREVERKVQRLRQYADLQLQEEEKSLRQEIERDIRQLQRQAREIERERLEEEQRRQQEAERRIQKAERARLEEEQDHERRMQKANREAQEERRRALTAEELVRRTTLDEYITACHELVFSEWKVESGEALTTEAPIPIANPRNKLCPTNLRPWSDFLQQQKITLGQLYETFSLENQVFDPRAFLAGQGGRMSRYPIWNENTLAYTLHGSVIDPIKEIMRELQKADDFRGTFDVGNGVVFNSNPNAMSEVGEEVIACQATSSPAEIPNQIRFYRSDGEPTRRTLIYISDYKAPQKLTAQHLRRGLRSMNVFKEVVNRETAPTSADPEERFQYYAERLTVAALTQTYHYMILDGLEYGMLATGEAFVFLKIDWEEPDTLYYHLAEPKSEAAAHPHDIPSCAAVGQYLAFSLAALGSPGQRRGHGQDERERAKTNLGTWNEDFESMLRSIPEEERQAPEGSSTCAPTTYSTFDRSPVVAQPTNDGKIESRPKTDEDSGNAPQRDYCTQKCLLGLVNGSRLDPQCPNVTSHRRESDKSAKHACLHHPVPHDEWLQLLSQQLEQSLDRGVAKLGIQGARGVLFQVTMLAYGYTFVCKGTVRAFIKDLEHEAAVYERLKAVQGISVPVFLGAVDLRPVNRTYYYDHRVDVIYMTFLAWGGRDLHRARIEESEIPELEASLSRALGAVHQEGVAHRDVRTPNMLRNHETGGVMLIDFERALLLDPLDRRFDKDREMASMAFYDY